MVSTELDKHHYRDENITLTVEQPPDGFWVSLQLLAKVPLTPSEIFDILTNEKNANIFRSVKEMRNRKVLSDDGHGKCEVEVEQVGRWRFGPFRGKFSVKLLVSQDKRHGTVAFRLAPSKKPSSFMHDFSGSWKVQHYTPEAWEEFQNPRKQHWGPLHNISKALHNWEDQVTGRHKNSSLVELRQSVAPAMIPPSPLDKILKKITAAQVRTIMEDLLREADRRNEEKAKNNKDQLLLETHIKKL